MNDKAAPRIGETCVNCLGPIAESIRLGSWYHLTTGDESCASLATSVPDETVEALATRIADDLFRNHMGEEADHLRMVQDLEQPFRYLGGWSKKAVIHRIVSALSAKGE